MNTPTLIASLIMAAVLAVSAFLMIRAMLRGRLRRAQRQAELVRRLPSVPDTVGPAPGLYVGSTLVPGWLDRIAVGDLGYHSNAVLTRHGEGIMVKRSDADPHRSGIAGMVVPRCGILAIRWRLPSGTEIDRGFRGDDRRNYAEWLRGTTQ